MSGAVQMLGAALSRWLEDNALSLDTETKLADETLIHLAAEGALGVGVPATHGGAGGDVVDGVEAIAAASELSLAAGFVLWSQRAYIECLLHSPNVGLRDAQLPALLAGRIAGAVGLSNAMKALGGVEDLLVKSRRQADGFILDGKLPWVTNLRRPSFHVAAAASHEDGRGAFVLSLSHQDSGCVRSADFDLMGLRGANTAALTISGVAITRQRVIHPDAEAWLKEVRPSFLGLQCGMSIGLARRALAEARNALGPGRGAALAEPVAEAARELADQECALREGLRSGLFRSHPAALFRIRIALAEIVGRTVALELQGSGGRAYLTSSGAGFARRWREAAVIPVITPSLVQLKTVLAAAREVGLAGRR